MSKISINLSADASADHLGRINNRDCSPAKLRPPSPFSGLISLLFFFLSLGSWAMTSTWSFLFTWNLTSFDEECFLLYLVVNGKLSPFFTARIWPSVSWTPNMSHGAVWYSISSSSMSSMSQSWSLVKLHKLEISCSSFQKFPCTQLFSQFLL